MRSEIPWGDTANVTTLLEANGRLRQRFAIGVVADRGMISNATIPGPNLSLET
jgi:hypothetical protein